MYTSIYRLESNEIDPLFPKRQIRKPDGGLHNLSPHPNINQVVPDDNNALKSYSLLEIGNAT